MTQKEKSLLLQDLCARLPYGCDLYVEDPERLPDNEHISVGFIGGYALNKDACQEFLINDVLEDLDNGSIVKPYLRPMESMTDEEKVEIRDLYHQNTQEVFKDPPEIRVYRFYDISVVDWLNKKGFDYRGLIPMGLALPATEDMYH